MFLVGAVVFFRLVSNCGISDLDLFTEDGEKIDSIRKLIDFLTSDDKLMEILRDETIGEFTKSELFWAVQDCVIIARRNNQAIQRMISQIKAQNSYYDHVDDYTFNSIIKKGEIIECAFVLVDYLDSFETIEYYGLSIEACVEKIADELEDSFKVALDTYENIEFIRFRPDFSKRRPVPATLDDLNKRIDEVLHFRVTNG